ncbi:MAG: ComEC/Rec2 family competence protein, partial [Thiohalorhabdaceae bacterium]
WQWGRVQFEVLAPEPAGPGEGNNASRVLRIRAGGDSLLLPGDLEAAGERRLLAEVGDVGSDVVVAPHHGSNTSSTEPFVKGVGPGVVVFSTGYKNQWGLPEPEVVGRYRRAGAAVWRTARSGAVRVRLGDGVQVAGYRQRADGYWHAGSRPPPLASLASLAD